MTTPTQLFTLLDACFDAQNEATALWHSQEPEAADVAPDASASPETLLALVRAQHLRNFRLWHIEDTARRRDVTPDVIADCKYRIDRLNQERNDRIERVDACLVALLSPCSRPRPRRTSIRNPSAWPSTVFPSSASRSGTWTSRSGAPT